MSTEGAPLMPEEPKQTPLREQLDFSKESGLDSDYTNAYAPLLVMVTTLVNDPASFTMLAQNPEEFANMLRRPILNYDEYMEKRHVAYQGGEQTAEIIRAHARGGYLLAVKYLVGRCNKLRVDLLTIFERGLDAVKENENQIIRDVQKLKKNLETLDAIVIRGAVSEDEAGQEKKDEE